MPAFALALRATPNRLLLTRTAHADQAVEVTPEYEVPELDAWMWALGERPLHPVFDAPQLPEVLSGDRERWFVQENRPPHAPDSPVVNPVLQQPELAKAIIRIGIEARRLGVGVQAVHYAVEYAYLTAGLEGGERADERI